MNAPATSMISQATQDHQMVPMGETAGQAAASQARAMVEARYAIAYRKPRDIDQVRAALLKECKRPFFADVALWSRKIGQDTLTGPSIRFAETAMRCMTNLDCGAMTIYDDREKRIVRVWANDLEANIGYSKDITVAKSVERKKPKQTDVVIRVRINSYGEEVSLIEAGDDDVSIKEAALISKASRTLLLRLIPGDLVDEALFFIKKTQKDKDAKDPDGSRLQLFDAFGEIGVRIEQIKEFLGHDGAVLTPKELMELRGFFAAIRDGEVTSFSEAVEKRKPREQPTDLADLEAQVKAQSAGAAKPVDPIESEKPKDSAGKATRPARNGPATHQPDQAGKAESTPTTPAGDTASDFFRTE